MQTITVVINGGKAQVKTQGFAGKACMDATAQLERAMGMRTADAKTPEFHQKEVQQAGQ